MTTSELTITNVSFDINSYKYRCYIQSAGGHEYSEDAVLTANKVTGINHSVRSSLELYPNPAIDYISIKNLPANSSAKIYDAQGIIVKSFSSSEQPLDIQDLPNGFYFIVLQNIDATLVNSFIIAK